MFVIKKKKQEHLRNTDLKEHTHTQTKKASNTERERERPVDLDTCFNQVFFYRKGRSGAEPDEQHVSGNGTLIFGIVQDQKHPQIQLVTCYGIPGRHACVEVWAMEDILSEQD